MSSYDGWMKLWISWKGWLYLWFRREMRCCGWVDMSLWGWFVSGRWRGREVEWYVGWCVVMGLRGQSAWF